MSGPAWVDGDRRTARRHCFNNGHSVRLTDRRARERGTPREHLGYGVVRTGPTISTAPARASRRQKSQTHRAWARRRRSATWHWRWTLKRWRTPRSCAPSPRSALANRKVGCGIRREQHLVDAETNEHGLLSKSLGESRQWPSAWSVRRGCGVPAPSRRLRPQRGANVVAGPPGARWPATGQRPGWSPRTVRAPGLRGGTSVLGVV